MINIDFDIKIYKTIHTSPLPKADNKVYYIAAHSLEEAQAIAEEYLHFAKQALGFTNKIDAMLNQLGEDTEPQATQVVSFAPIEEITDVFLLQKRLDIRQKQ